MTWLNRERMSVVWRALRRTVLDPERIRRAFTYNLPLKLLSLLLAFSLWFFVNFGERDTEESLKVPLELRNIPAHLMITSPRVDFVDVRVSGPRTLLGRIDRNRLSEVLDLSGVRPGPSVFRVDAESLSLPRGVKVVRINPAQVTLELERVGHKSVPVRIRLRSRPPPDLEVVDTKASPETVEVTGPMSDIADVHAANTDPVDLSKATAGTLEKELPLVPAGEYVSFSATRVAVEVRIAEVSATREFRRVAVEVRHAPARARVVPERVRLIVRGPKHVVADLELEPGAVYVDAQGEEVGEHDMKVRADLPAGIKLDSVEPSTVRLIIGKRGRGGHGRR
jgi:YbbR domain-containing protein